MTIAKVRGMPLRPPGSSAPTPPGIAQPCFALPASPAGRAPCPHPLVQRAVAAPQPSARPAGPSTLPPMPVRPAMPGFNAVLQQRPAPSSRPGYAIPPAMPPVAPQTRPVPPVRTGPATVQMVARSPKKKAKKGRPRILTPKEQRQHRIDVVRQVIEAYLIEKMGLLTYKKSIHSSRLFAGVKVRVVKPVAMSRERLIVRHIATTLLAQDPGMTEVQAAISHSARTIYIASNSKQSVLENLVAGSLSGLGVPPPRGYAGRERRHMRKLLREQAGPYRDYTLKVIRAREGQHAETKIVDAGVDFDYIGGTRRPCLACTLYMRQKGIDSSKFNPHSGAYWNSNLALSSFASGSGDVGAAVSATMRRPGVPYDTHFVSEGLEASRIYDYDTDSETEEEIPVFRRSPRLRRNKG